MKAPATITTIATRSAKSAASTPAKARSLTDDVFDRMYDRVRDGTWAAEQKLPREADLIEEFGVSRTVVREAMSRLQAAGVLETRHGVGTFVVGLGNKAQFRVSAAEMGTLRDVIHVLELRIAIETEAAGLAAQRRTSAQLRAMRKALNAFEEAVNAQRQAIGPDVQFHLEIARATDNPRFPALMEALGAAMIPRARLEGEKPLTAAQQAYLAQVHIEHQSIFRAIEQGDADAARAAMRMHLSNSRERRREALDKR